jgi:hypothetical protein
MTSRNCRKRKLEGNRRRRSRKERLVKRWRQKDTENRKRCWIVRPNRLVNSNGKQRRTD